MLKRLLPAAFALALFAAPATAADKLTVLLDWFVNPDHAPLIIAKEQGYFERHGLDVELIAPADASAPPRLVAAGQGDVAITYQPDLMLQLQEGLPLIRFGTLIETPLNSVIVLEDGPIKTLADLKGKKIGYSVASIQSAYLTAMLASVGLTMDDVEMVNVNFNLVTALLAGQVDATIDGYRNFELTQLRLEGKTGKAFYPEENGVPIYDELVYVTRDALRDDPRLPRFLAAIEEATVFITNHPEESRAMFMASHVDLDDELNRVAYDLTIPRFAKRPAALDAGRYDRFGEFLKESGLLEIVPPVESYTAVVR